MDMPVISKLSGYVTVVMRMDSEKHFKNWKAHLTFYRLSLLYLVKTDMLTMLFNGGDM